MWLSMLLYSTVSCDTLYLTAELQSPNLKTQLLINEVISQPLSQVNKVKPLEILGWTRLKYKTSECWKCKKLLTKNSEATTPELLCKWLSVQCARTQYSSLALAASTRRSSSCWGNECLLNHKLGWIWPRWQVWHTCVYCNLKSLLQPNHTKQERKRNDDKQVYKHHLLMKKKKKKSRKSGNEDGRVWEKKSESDRVLYLCCHRSTARGTKTGTFGSHRNLEYKINMLLEGKEIIVSAFCDRYIESRAYMSNTRTAIIAPVMIRCRYILSIRHENHQPNHRNLVTQKERNVEACLRVHQ